MIYYSHINPMKYDLGEIIPQNVIYIHISFIFKVELL